MNNGVQFKWSRKIPHCEVPHFIPNGANGAALAEGNRNEKSLQRQFEIRPTFPVPFVVKISHESVFSLFWGD